MSSSEEELTPSSKLSRYFETTLVRFLSVEEEQEIVRLCREHPELVSQKFRRNRFGPEWTPLEFLLRVKARLKTIQAICNAYPEAHALSVPALCGLSANSREPGVIAFMIQSKVPPLDEAQAIHALRALVSGRSASALMDVQCLLETYFPNGFPSFAQFLTILKEAFGGQNSPEVIKHIVTASRDTTGDEISTVNWSYSGGGKQAVHHSTALASVFQRVKSVELHIASRLDIEGWNIMLQSLARSTQLVKLTISLRRVYSENMSMALLDGLSAALSASGYDALERFCMDGNGWTSTRCDITDAMESFLTQVSNKKLEFLRVASFQMQHDRIFLAIQSNNNKLKHFAVPCCLDNVEKLNGLLNVLKHHNTTLESVAVSHVSVVGSIEDRGIKYFCVLNALGRRNARLSTTNLNDFVSFLSSRFPDLLNSNQVAIYEKFGRVPFLYGLLRENPSMWCAAQLAPNLP
ncbi:expressed unknown protein [Seminavis robusta]|uniref:Uncharacterized protein n=1 Tax=Seminavis robusta TaxID=568900 RepID=A0A9N8DIN6_9STRA|nr:expressed unknown protein [Seminavis robusta]|eukprot:Sro173_g076450.1 n/a (464) ;mRNA; r:80494-81885